MSEKYIKYVLTDGVYEQNHDHANWPLIGRERFSSSNIKLSWFVIDFSGIDHADAQRVVVLATQHASGILMKTNCVFWGKEYGRKFHGSFSLQRCLAPGTMVVHNICCRLHSSYKQSPRVRASSLATTAVALIFFDHLRSNYSLISKKITGDRHKPFHKRGLSNHPGCAAGSGVFRKSSGRQSRWRTL